MTPAVDVDAYLAALPEPARSTLAAWRAIIRKLMPHATEVIAYGLPSYRLERVVVSFGAAKAHCALYAMNAEVQARFPERLQGYRTSAGTIRFPLAAPPPPELIRDLVLARLEQHEARVAAGRSKPSARP